jgi:hypothetical protein
MAWFKRKPAEAPLVRKNVNPPAHLGEEAMIYWVKMNVPEAVFIYCRRCHVDILIDDFLGHECATVKE